MQAQHICLAQGRFEFAGTTTAGDQPHRHSEGLRNGRHAPADRAGPHHGEGAAGQLLEFRLHQSEHRAVLPGALLHLAPPGLQIADQLEDQRPGHLHHRGRAVATGIAHGDTQLAAGLAIDLVGAGASRANQPQLGQLPQQLSIQPDLVGDRDRGSLQPLQA